MGNSALQQNTPIPARHIVVRSIPQPKRVLPDVHRGGRSDARTLRTTICLAGILGVLWTGAPLYAAPSADPADEYFRNEVKPYLLPQCWTFAQCNKANGQFVTARNNECDLTFTGALGTQPKLGHCFISSVGRYPVTSSIPIGGLIVIKDIGQLIVVLYKFAVAAAIVLAIIVILTAGIRYTTSAGSPEVMRAAREKIANALIGLMLLLSSYLILFTINPDLVNLRPPAIQRLRTPDQIAEHLAALYGNQALTGSTIIACDTEWVNRLNGFRKEGTAYVAIKEEADKLPGPVKCGTVVPPRSQGSVACVLTYCVKADEICLLLADGKSGSVKDTMGKKGFGECVNRASAIKPVILHKGDSWALSFDGSAGNKCGTWDEGFLSSLTSKASVSAGLSLLGINAPKDITVNTNCPDVQGGTTCYTYTAVPVSTFLAVANNATGLFTDGSAVNSHLYGKTTALVKPLVCPGDVQSPGGLEENQPRRFEHRLLTPPSTPPAAAP